MKILSALLLASQLLALSNVYASAYDIQGSRYVIKTTKDSNNKITFLLCDHKKRPTSCDYIGRKSGYSQKELNLIKQSELVEARWKTGGAVVIGVLGAFTGFGAGMVLSGAAGSVTGAITAVETVEIVALSAGGASSSLWFNRLNPFHQYDQVEVLDRDGLLSQKLVVTSDEEVLEVSQLLGEILVK